MDSRNLVKKRVTIFAGHYGSGKTNLAVNFAVEAAKENPKTVIADLDIVNPYFRTKDSAEVLEKNGIRLISSEYANTNVDTPAIPAEAYSPFEDKSFCAIIDVGGDDRGALALGRYVPLVKEENNYEFLFVINKYRYLTKNAEDTLEIMKEIEKAAGLKFTGIVNNSNLGEETDEEAVLDSFKYAEEVSRLSGLEIKMTAVKHDLYDKLKGKADNLFPMHLYVRQSWLREKSKDFSKETEE